MNTKPPSDQSPYVLNFLAKFCESDLLDVEKSNRIRVDAQLETQKKIDELVERSKAFRDAQFDKMCDELRAECPEKSKQDLLNHQISNFQADLIVKDQVLDRERDDINKMLFESLEEHSKNSTNLVVQEYGNRGLSSAKFEQIKNDPKQPVPTEFAYQAAPSNPEQSGMTTRQQVNWFKALPAKENPDGVQKVRLFVRLVDDESKATLNARLVGKDTARPYYLLEGVYTPPNAPSGGAMRLMAGFRDYLIQTGAEAVVEENQYNVKIANFFLNNGFKVSPDGKEMTYHGLLERPHRAEMLEALKIMVQENTGIVSLGGKEHKGAVYEYFGVTVIEGVQSPTSGKTLLNHQDMFRIKAEGPDGVEIKHQVESQFSNEVSALGLNRRSLLADLQTATMLCAAELGLGLESQWTAKIDLPSGLEGGRFDRAQVNEEMKQGIEPMGIAALHPKGANGYEKVELRTASLDCVALNLPDSSDAKNKSEVPKTKQSNVSKAVPPPLPQMRRSTLDEIENPEVKEKKESKSKTKRKADKELENGS